MTRKSSNDGMGMVALMPFPAFNMLNWGALALPRNAMLASMHNAQLMLDAWRTSADCVRAMTRLQQDEMLQWLQTPVNAATKEAEDAGESAEDAQQKVQAEAETTAALLMQPVIEATRAYGQVGRAFIVAQRDTMRAFARQDAQS